MIRDPLRLLDDPTTGAALRRDLGAALHSQRGYDVDAGLGRFESTLASDLAHETGRSGAMGGGLYSGLAVGALLLAGGLATLGWQLTRPTVDPSWESQVGSPAVVPAWEDTREDTRTMDWAMTPVVPSVDPSAPSMVVAGDELGVADGSEVAMTARPSRTRKTSASREAHDAAYMLTPEGDYLREARALNTVRGMLTRDSAQALKLAQAGAAEFHAGTFAPEWEGVVVLALIELGRDDEARTRGETYLQRHPSGTYAPRIRQAIEGRK